MSLKEELMEAVGSSQVKDDSKTLEEYSRDQSFVPARRPDYVVFPGRVEEVQEVVRIANRHLAPVIPYSSGLNLHGATIPDHGGIILNFSRMNKIEEINTRDRFAIIEPGVTFRQLQEELNKEGFRILPPFGVPSERSVISSYIERDPSLASADFDYGNDLMMDMEIVLPNGDIFRTGLWSATGGKEAGSPWGPMSMITYRFWTGAQGTFGVVTRMVVKIEYIPKKSKVFFLTFDKLEDTIEPLKRIQRKEIGMECFLLNSFNLSALLAEDWEVPDRFPCKPKESGQFEAQRKTLPPWTLMIRLYGLIRRPEERLAYEEEVLREVGAQANVEVKETVDGIVGLESIVLGELLRPWGILKKFNYRGTCHPLAFYAPLDRVADLEKLLDQMAEAYGYPGKDIGKYVLPIERGRSFYCEFDFHCDFENKEETERVKGLWLKASEQLMDGGAYFERPYGAWAEMVYRRAGAYAAKLKDLKGELDPNNVMNPGKLCF